MSGGEWPVANVKWKRNKLFFRHLPFVTWGIGKESVWREVKGQSIPGGDDFIEGLITGSIKNTRTSLNYPRAIGM